MKKIILGLLLALAAIQPAIALGLHHGTRTGPLTPTAPVLANTTVTFGQNTPSGRGWGVRLSGMDQTIPSYQPTMVYGLDLMTSAGPACDTWVSFTFDHNTSGRTGADFNVNVTANQAESASVVAPSVSSTGAGHLAGDYVWNVTCSHAGSLSNVGTLTYHTVANLSTVAPYDRFDFGWAASNFGSVAGAKVCLATGGDFHNLNVTLRGVTTGGTVIFTVCDSPRYPYVSNFTTQAINNVHVTDIVATGNTDVGIQVAKQIFGSSGTGHTNGEWDNLHYYGSTFMYSSTSNNSGQGFFGNACSGTCYLHDSSADFVNSGFNITDYLHASNVDIAHFANNCTAIASGSVGATVDNFTTCHDPIVSVGGQHTDCMQVLDGATAYAITINNFWCIQAGGTAQPQGPIFGGTQFGLTNRVTTGYFTNGVLTISSGGCLSSSNGSQIWVPAGGISIADNARIFCSAGQTTNIATSLGNTFNLGSSGSPVTISNVGVYSLQMEGIVDADATFNGFASSGESGTSFLRHFSYVQHIPNPLPTVSFTGTINGAISPYGSGLTITVAGPGTSSYPNVMEPNINGAVNYSGCTTCNTAGAQPGTGICCELQSTEAVQASANASFSGNRMTVSAPCTGRFDYNIANGAHSGGLLISGTGIPDGISIIPQLALPSDGCAGNYTLSGSVGTLSSRAVVARPQQGAGLYSVFSTTGVPGGPFAMTSLPITVVSLGSGASVSQTGGGGSPGCVSNLHQGSFNIDRGYAGFISVCSGATAPNTTVTNTASPVAADFNTGVIPYTTLNAITATTWNAMTTAQKRAAYCNAMLPAATGNLVLGGGDYVGSFTHTGEIQLAGGNVAVSGCGIH